MLGLRASKTEVKIVGNQLKPNTPSAQSHCHSNLLGAGCLVAANPFSEDFQFIMCPLNVTYTVTALRKQQQTTSHNAATFRKTNERN